MKLLYDPDSHQWDLPEAAFNAQLENMVVELEKKRLCLRERRKFQLTSLFVVVNSAAAATALIFVPFFGIFVAFILTLISADLVQKYCSEAGDGSAT